MTATPFLNTPAPNRCKDCGAVLDLECERDLMQCLDCQCEQALGVPKPAPGSIHPLFAHLLRPFTPSPMRTAR